MFPHHPIDPTGARPTTSHLSVDTWLSTVLLAAVMFLPAGVCYLYTGTSHSPGTAIACIMVLLALTWRAPAPEAFLPISIIVTLIGIHLVLALALTSDQSSRAVLSIGLLALVLIATFTLAKWLFLRTPKVIDQTTRLLRLLMIVIALATIVGLQPSGAKEWEKAIFPFTEPSHFALIFTPLLLDACVKSRGWRRYTWIIVGYLLAFSLKNLSLLVGTTLVSMVTLPLLQLTFGALIAPMVLLSVNLSYFTDRLDFSAQTTNLSALVYIQGWELVIDSMRRSLGWGIGYQQLGYGPIRSAASEMIFQLTQFDLNLQDGGFVAAKLISEFGIFGAMLMVGFIVVATKSALTLRKVAHGALPRLAGRDFALAIIVGYSLDMFVRGVAYFTASSALFVAALIYYLKFRQATPVPAPLLIGYR
jgi:hypothetical protein